MNKTFFKKGYKTASVIAILLLVPAVAGAADIEVLCTTSGGGVSCEATPTGIPLFDEDNLVPGETVIRELEVNNSHSEECTLAINTENEEAEELDLADRLFTVIRDVTDRYGVSDGSAAASNKTMSDLFADSPILLGPLAANSITNYEWAVTFDVEAGNDWQNTKTTFNFDMVFTCDEGAVRGAGDEQDCCPGPDPTPSRGGAVLGITSGTPPGNIAGTLLSKFPVAGKAGTSLWLAKDEADWSRAASGLIAVALGSYLILRTNRKKWARNE